MLRHRIIPVVLIDGFSVLKTVQFKQRRNLGSPVTVMQIYNTRNVDELILLDIDASKENRHLDFFAVEMIATECFMPLTVGGGLRTCAEIQMALSKGADKVVINTAALENPALIRESSSNFGSQCIVASVDVQKKGDGYTIFSHAGISTDDMEVLSWCKELEQLGAGEIFINAVDLDGQMTGYDGELIRRVTTSVRIPVIACGGASKPEDCVTAIQAGASAAAVASIFHFTDYTPDDCRKALRGAGIPAR